MKSRTGCSRIDTVATEELAVCPQCYSGAFESAHRCPVCEEYFTRRALHNDLCAPCKQQRRIGAMQYLNAGLQANYGERRAREIRGLIEAATDGVAVYA